MSRRNLLRWMLIAPFIANPMALAQPERLTASNKSSRPTARQNDAPDATTNVEPKGHVTGGHAARQSTAPTRDGSGAAERATPGTPEVVGAIPPILVDGAKNSGHSWLYIRNPTNRKMTVTLIAERFKADGRDLDARLSFAASAETTDTPFTPVEVEAGALLPIKLVVSNYTYAGTAVALLRVGDRVHQVFAVLYQVPFKVAPQTGGAEKWKVTLTRNERGRIALKNDDSIAYPLSWRMSLAGTGDVAQGNALVPAASQIEIVLDPPRSWWRHDLTGMFKDELQPGYFSVQFAPPEPPRVEQPSAAARSAAPLRAFPVEFELAYGFWQRLAGDVLILLALALGAILSMILNLWIPSYVRRAKLLVALGDLANDTRQIFQHVDSRLRVSLRVERLRLSEGVKAIRVPSLAVADALNKYEMATARLRRRIDLALEVDAADSRIEELRSANTGAPPSLLDDAAEGLRDAIAVLIKKAPTDDELASAKSAVAGANARLEQIGQENPKFKEALAARIVKLRAVYDESGGLGGTAGCHAWKDDFSDVFKVLEEGATIQVASYDGIDLNLRRLELLQSFIRVENDDSDPGQSIARACRPELVAELKKHDWHSLSRARCLVNQVEEQVASAAIEAELRGGVSVRIDCEPRAVHANEPVRLRVRFDNPNHDDSAARRGLSHGPRTRDLGQRCARAVDEARRGLWPARGGRGGVHRQRREGSIHERRDLAMM